jgi:hypothetical protein
MGRMGVEFFMGCESDGELRMDLDTSMKILQ